MRFDDVWVRYPGRGNPWVLQGVSAQLDAGEAVTVTGRNGTGKSTLLSTAAGLLRPGRGRVTGRPRRVGYVPERFPADQPFTARRYLTAMAAAHGNGPVAPDIAAWAERLHLTPLLDVALHELSKGSAQKVGLIQAMLARPELLILDEPWEGLDAAARQEVPLIIADVVAAGGRVLVSDHLGQTADLPGMRRWELDAGVVRATAGESADCVVEVGVAAAEVTAAVASLRAAGHRILRIRAEGPRT